MEEPETEARTYFIVLPGFLGFRPVTGRVAFYWPSRAQGSTQIQGRGRGFHLFQGGMTGNMCPSSVCHHISKSDAIKQPDICFIK